MERSSNPPAETVLAGDLERVPQTARSAELPSEPASTGDDEVGGPTGRALGKGVEVPQSFHTPIVRDPVGRLGSSECLPVIPDDLRDS